MNHSRLFLILFFIGIKDVYSFAQDFRLQIIAKIDSLPKLYFDTKNISDIKFNTDQNGICRYHVGEYWTRTEAEKVRRDMVKKGFANAQVIDLEEQRALCGTPCPYITNTTTFISSTTEQLFLRNIYFDYNKSSLRQEAYKDLDEMYQILKTNPSYIGQFIGHTDAKGSAARNTAVAIRRARTARNYLINKGIAAYRFKTRIFGESSPVTVNKDADGKDSPDGRQYNRRVVLVVLDGTGEIIRDFAQK